jgi:hypothetical protein
VPKSLAEALSALQDDMKPFDGETAREIVWRELHSRVDKGELLTDTNGGSVGQSTIQIEDLETLMTGLTDPVAAASIGQVYKSYLPGKGDVAVKVQRPGVRKLVEVRLPFIFASSAGLYIPLMVVSSHHPIYIYINIIQYTMTISEIQNFFSQLPSSSNLYQHYPQQTTPTMILNNHHKLVSSTLN